MHYEAKQIIGIHDGAPLQAQRRGKQGLHGLVELPAAIYRAKGICVVGPI
jgi:hypothetical protein